MEEIPEQYVWEQDTHLLEIQQASGMVKLLLAGNGDIPVWLIGWPFRGSWLSGMNATLEVEVWAAKAALNIYPPWFLSLAKDSLFNKFLHIWPNAFLCLA